MEDFILTPSLTLVDCVKETDLKNQVKDVKMKI